jgi:hypothetical protein
MTRTHVFVRQVTRLWLSAWPFWTLLVFASLAAVRLLPGGYARAAVAAPILLAVPGALTLGAVFSGHHRPRGVLFAGYAVLLSVVWSVFASLALYMLKVLITAESTYWCLLVVSALLTIAAEARLVPGRSHVGPRSVPESETLDPDWASAEADDDGPPAAVRGAGYYAIGAVVAGLSLLAGGVYVQDHLPHPAPTGYTWMAWTGPRVNGAIAIGAAGAKLPFQIAHRQSHTTTFRLRATWLGAPSRLLAGPLTVSIGPEKTFHGVLFVPPPPNGCTYRIVVTLTAAQQVESRTRHPLTWSINADVHRLGKSPKTCGS